MAILATIETDAGDNREVYLRINSIEGLNNHGSPCSVRFRAYASKLAFTNRKAFLWERSFEFTPDVKANIWQQAYDAFKAKLADEANPLQTTVASPLVDVQ
jgi:hypothetical protein